MLAPYLLLVTNGPGGLNVQPGGTAPANGAPGGAVRAGSGPGLIPKLAALVVLVVVIVLCLRWLVRSVRASQSARRSV